MDTDGVIFLSTAGNKAVFFLSPFLFFLRIKRCKIALTRLLGKGLGATKPPDVAPLLSCLFLAQFPGNVFLDCNLPPTHTHTQPTNSFRCSTFLTTKEDGFVLRCHGNSLLSPYKIGEGRRKADQGEREKSKLGRPISITFYGAYCETASMWLLFEVR